MDIRTAIWDARLNAKFMAMYYGCKCARYQRMDRAYSSVAAFFGSAAIAAWFNEHASPAVPVFALAGILIALLPYSAHLGKWVVENDFARAHWARRDLTWDLLWLESETDRTSISAERVGQERIIDADFHEPNSPPDPKLAAKCQLDVHRSLGLRLPEDE